MSHVFDMLRTYGVAPAEYAFISVVRSIDEKGFQRNFFSHECTISRREFEDR